MTTLFSTERFDVLELAPEHLDDMLEVYGDVDAMRYVDDGEPLGREEGERWVEVTRRNVEERGYGMSAVVDRAAGRVVGFAGLVHPGGQETPELKYAYRREVWGTGVATEVARGMAAWGEGRFGMQRMIATVDPRNAPSIRVCEKAGFVREADRAEEDGSLTAVFVRDTRDSN